MKNLQIALVLFPLVLSNLSAPVAANPSSTLSQPVSSFTVVELEREIDVRVIEVVKPRPGVQSLAPELGDIELLIKGLGLALQPYPGECRIQARLEAEIADLRARSNRYMVRAADAISLQQEIVLNRLERSVIHVGEELREHKATREETVKIVSALESQAFDFIDSLGMPTTRVRLINAIAALTADAHAQMDPYENVRAFYVELMEARIEMALRQLGAHAADNRVTARDFARVVEAYQAQALLVESALAIPYDCGS